MGKQSFQSELAPTPAGSYSIAVQAGSFVFLAGQTPRDRENVRHGGKPFSSQARMALDNLEAAAKAAGLSLRDAVKVNVFLKDPLDAKEFDSIYSEYVRDPLPARTLVQSNLVGFDIEVDAILLVPADHEARESER